MQGIKFIVHNISHLFLFSNVENCITLKKIAIIKTNIKVSKNLFEQNVTYVYK
jgi:hypothetical protein